MPIQPAETGERWRRSLDSHLAHIPHRQAEVLVLFALGLSNAEIAVRLDLKLATVLRHSAQARQLVVPPEYEPTRANAQSWASAHLRCCLATWFAVFCEVA